MKGRERKKQAKQDLWLDPKSPHGWGGGWGAKLGTAPEKEAEKGRSEKEPGRNRPNRPKAGPETRSRQSVGGAGRTWRGRPRRV